MAERATRERFLALDGLRGIAAIAVLLYHVRSMFRVPGLFTHGYLAVDFFFMLSGFVIAYAYEERLRERGSLGPFLRDRIIRLHPLLLLSLTPWVAVLALSIVRGTDFPYPLSSFIAAVVPFPGQWIGLSPGFRLNIPSWSLFWELAINLAFALVAPRLGNRMLGAVIAVAVTGAVWVSLVNGTMAFADMTAGFRAVAGFAIGVMLLRVHRTGRFRADWLGVAAAPLLLVLLVAVPGFRGWAGYYDPVVVFLLFPPILLASAAREVRFPAACALLGGLSYPLYILHGPLLVLLKPRLISAMPNTVTAGLLFCAIVLAVSLIAWRFYDEPVRAALRRRFVRRLPEKRDRPAA